MPSRAGEQASRLVRRHALQAAAVAAPRPHTEGTPAVEVEAAWPAAELAALPSLGYKIKTAASATVSAASFDPHSGECRAAMR